MISVVYILVGDSFYPNKIYFNLENALEKLKNTSPYTARGTDKWNIKLFPTRVKSFESFLSYS